MRQTERPFRVEMVAVESSPLLEKIVVEEPWVSFRRFDESVSDMGLLSNVALTHDTDVVKKYLLPELDPEAFSLIEANMRIYVHRANGSGQLAVSHNLLDNDFEPDVSDFESDGYVEVDRSIDTSDGHMPRRYYDVDVTELVHADYENDTEQAVTALRLEAMGDAEELPDFRVTWSRNRNRYPQLVLSFVSTAVDCITDSQLDHQDLTCISAIESRVLVLRELGSLPGDLNGDAIVDFVDFQTLSANFGSQLASYAEGDIDLSGRVDFPDFLTLSSNFGASHEIHSVPEPDAVPFGIVICTIITLFRKLRRSRPTKSGFHDRESSFN